MLLTLISIGLCNRTVALFGLLVALVVANPASAQTRTVALTETDTGTRPDEFFDEFYAPVLNDRSNVSFGALLQNGSGTLDFQDNYGIWHSASGELRIVTRRDVNPTDPVFGPCRSNDVRLTNRDQTLFSASEAVTAVEGGGFRCSNAGLWSDDNGVLGNVIDRSVPLDGTGGATSNSESVHGSNKNGVVAFEAIPAGFNRGVWAGEGATTRLIVTNGEVVPVIGNETATFATHQFSFIEDQFYLISEGGDVAVRGVALFADGRNPAGLWLDDGDFRLVAMGGSPITKSPDGPIFLREEDFFQETFSQVHVNEVGVFFAGLAEIGVSGITSDNDEGLYVFQNNEIRTIAQEGQTAHGTTTVFSSAFGGTFRESAVGPTGATAFIARTSPFPFRQGVWVERNGKLELVSSPELSVFSNVAINGNEQVAFVESGVGLMAETTAGDLVNIAEFGQPFEVAPGDFRTLTNVEFAGSAALNELGQIAFAATFSDGTSGVFVSDLVMVPEPGMFCSFAWLLLTSAVRRKRNA